MLPFLFLDHFLACLEKRMIFPPSFFLCQNPQPPIVKCPYEERFQKNLHLIKEKFKTLINLEFSSEHVLGCVRYLAAHTEKANQTGSSKKETLKNKIYCFLSALSFYEVDTQSCHRSYVFSQIN